MLRPYIFFAPPLQSSLAQTVRPSGRPTVRQNEYRIVSCTW